MVSIQSGLNGLSLGVQRCTSHTAELFLRKGLQILFQLMLHPPLKGVAQYVRVSPLPDAKLLVKLAAFDQRRACGLPLPQTEIFMRRNTASVGFRVAQSPRVLAHRTAASSLHRYTCPAARTEM